MIYFDNIPTMLYNGDIICEYHLKGGRRFRLWYMILYVEPALRLKRYRNITREVREWMKANKIRYPFSKEEKVLFALRFG